MPYDLAIAPSVREYWEQYKNEMKSLALMGYITNFNSNSNTKSSGCGTIGKKMKRDIGWEYELTMMCQVALLDAIQVFMMGIHPVSRHSMAIVQWRQKRE